MNDQFWTLGKLASHLGCQGWHILKLIEARRIPSARAGRYHIVRNEDVEKVRTELLSAGYVTTTREPALA